MKRKGDKVASEEKASPKKVAFGSAATNLSASLSEGLFDEITEGASNLKKPSGTYGVLIQYPKKVIESGAGSCLVSIDFVDLGQNSTPIWFMKTTAANEVFKFMAKKVSDKQLGSQIIYEALSNVFVVPTRASPYGQENLQKATHSKKNGSDYVVYHLATYIAASQTEEGMNSRVRELAETFAVMIQTQKNLATWTSTIMLSSLHFINWRQTT
jgi:CRISPR/Cas system CMR-associated protein Cmr5 small subunit